MKRRWILFDYADPILPLSLRERWRIGWKNTASVPRNLRSNQFVVALGLPLVMFGYGVLVMFVMQWTAAWPSRWLALLICLVPMPVVIWFAAAVLYRLTSRRAYLYRLQRAGYDICLECGMLLDTQNDLPQMCCACGTRADSSDIPDRKPPDTRVENGCDQ